MVSKNEAIYIIKQTYGRKKGLFAPNNCYVFWAVKLDDAFDYAEKMLKQDRLTPNGNWFKETDSQDYFQYFKDEDGFMGQFHISLLSEGI